MHDLNGDGLLIKKILKRGFGLERATYLDRVTLDLKIYKNEEKEENILLQNTDFEMQVDSSKTSTVINEILKSMKHNEHGITTVSKSFFQQDKCSLVPTEDCEVLLFDIQVKELTKVEDLFRDGCILKTVLDRPIGKNIPNQNATCFINYKVNGKDSLNDQLFLIKEGNLKFILDEEKFPCAWINAMRCMTEGETIQLDCNLLGLETERYLSDGLDPEFNLPQLFSNFKEKAHEWQSLVIIIELVKFEMGKVHYGMNYQDRLNEALRIKEIGNQLFKKNYIQRALERYEVAQSTLQPVKDSPALFRHPELQCLQNITICHLKLEQWSKAELNAGKALDIDSNDEKIWYRRAISRRNQSKLEEALSDIQEAKRQVKDKINQNQNDKQLRSRYNDIIQEEKVIRNEIKDYELQISQMFAGKFENRLTFSREVQVPIENQNEQISKESDKQEEESKTEGQQEAVENNQQ